MFKLTLLKLIDKNFRTFQDQTGWIFEDGFQRIKSFSKSKPPSFSSEFMEVYPVMARTLGKSKLLTINAEHRTFKLYSWKTQKKHFGIMFSQADFERKAQPTNELELLTSQIGIYEGAFNSTISLLSNRIHTQFRKLGTAPSDSQFATLSGTASLLDPKSFVSLSHSNEIFYDTHSNRMLISKQIQQENNLSPEDCITLSNLLNALFAKIENDILD